MDKLRHISAQEQLTLQQRGCYADCWGDLLVSEDFSPEQLRSVCFAGRVEIHSGVRISDSYISNYSIGARSVIEGCGRIECRKESSFGVGVLVNTINENGGRAVALTTSLTAQIAYVWALYRDRADMVQRLNAMAEQAAAESRSSMGRIGCDARIVGARFIREVNIGDRVVVDGASLLCDATILCDAFVGVDVKAEEFIAAEFSHIDTGATIKRCFIGESAIVGSGFSAVDSLIFSSSHLENGEAASIFAGPYSVSHHKSTLLIAGLFSFFNAGSGSNQSNHLFKCGAVHQAIHQRGCKFASGAYIMAPACEGPFTMVKGYHAHHHDTSTFPYSYLLDDSAGRSILMPAANLTSYGTQRDIKKWVERDRRRVCRDIINFERDNPYLTGAMVKAVNALHTLTERDQTADEYMWERTVIRRSHLKRGVGLYNKAIAAAIGSMLSSGKRTDQYISTGEWVDLAGAYIDKGYLDSLLGDLEGGVLSSFEQVDDRFRQFADHYADYAHSWAYALLSQLMGGEPTPEQLEQTIAAAQSAEAEIVRQCERDRARDCSMEMAVGYGVDSDDPKIKEADFRAVRNL